MAFGLALAMMLLPIMLLIAVVVRITMGRHVLSASAGTRTAPDAMADGILRMAELSATMRDKWGRSGRCFSLRTATARR